MVDEAKQDDVDEIICTAHAQQRRIERNLAMEDPPAVVRHGRKETADNGRWMYTFANVTVITDKKSTHILSCWANTGCGIDVDKVPITPGMELEHERAIKRLKNKSNWTSHTVAVVDQSGSMRNIDITKEVMRSDLVWLSLAVSVVSNGLKSGTRKATDMLSIVVMREQSQVVLEFQPFDWILFNNIVELLRSSRPSGPGCYIPALDAAESLLMANQYGGCALAMLFLSDGRPSDQQKRGDGGGYERLMAKYAKERIGKLSCQLGNRLAFSAVAIGKPNTDAFVVLKVMAEEAKEYGSRSFFQPASLSANLLTNTLTWLNSSVTATMVEMSEARSKGQRVYRKFTKMKLSEVGSSALTDTWDVVKNSQRIVRRGSRRLLQRSIVRTSWVHKQGWKAQSDIFHSNEAVGIAFEKRWFGEGAERIVKEFRELGSFDSFVGPPMVAKASKFIVDGEDADSKEFHKVFCKAQLLAQRMAEKFNARLQNLPGVDKATPRIEFLDCFVYMLDNEECRKGYLVERMLDIKRFDYKKWNDNIGTVYGSQQQRKTRLETISEEEEVDYSSNTSHEEMFSSRAHSVTTNPDTCFEVDDIPQAFSCFTYLISGGKHLVCDLQGILNTDKKPPIFELTDPVVHYSLSGKKSTKFGRTDKGKDGIYDFFKSHECSNLCRRLKRCRLREDTIYSTERMLSTDGWGGH
jgi:hypothetical protein